MGHGIYSRVSCLVVSRPIKQHVIEPSNPTYIESTGKDTNSAKIRHPVPKIIEKNTHFGLNLPGKNSANVSGTNVAVVRNPIDRKPKSLM